MEGFKCQHCGITGIENMCRCSSTICKQCLRNRPICWKVVLYSLANLAEDSTGIPDELKEPPQTRGKACCKLQNMSMPASKQLISIIKFDELYNVWYTKKCECQDAKGGGGAYADQCHEALFKYIESKTKSGELCVKSLEKFINYTNDCKSDIYWNNVQTNHESQDSDTKYESISIGSQNENESLSTRVSEIGENDNTPNGIDIITRNIHRKKRAKKQNLEIQRMQKMIDELKSREMLYVNIINHLTNNTVN